MFTKPKALSDLVKCCIVDAISEKLEDINNSGVYNFPITMGLKEDQERPSDRTINFKNCRMDTNPLGVLSEHIKDGIQLEIAKEIEVLATHYVPITGVSVLVDFSDASEQFWVKFIISKVSQRLGVFVDTLLDIMKEKGIEITQEPGDDYEAKQNFEAEFDVKHLSLDLADEISEALLVLMKAELGTTINKLYSQLIIGLDDDKVTIRTILHDRKRYVGYTITDVEEETK